MKSVWMSSTPRPEDRVVGQVAPLGDHLVPGPLRRRGAELARVVVREADAVLAAAAHALDRREEQVVVGEAEVRREHAVLEPLDRDVEALDEYVQLVLLGRGARLVDLDPLRTEVDQRLEVGADDVARDVERQLTAGLDLVLAREASAKTALLGQVVLVVRPDGQRVRAR